MIVEIEISKPLRISTGDRVYRIADGLDSGALEENESWRVEVDKEDSNWMKSFNKENTAETNATMVGIGKEQSRLGRPYCSVYLPKSFLSAFSLKNRKAQFSTRKSVGS